MLNSAHIGHRDDRADYRGRLPPQFGGVTVHDTNPGGRRDSRMPGLRRYGSAPNGQPSTGFLAQRTSARYQSEIRYSAESAVQPSAEHPNFRADRGLTIADSREAGSGKAVGATAKGYVAPAKGYVAPAKGYVAPAKGYVAPATPIGGNAA